MPTVVSSVSNDVDPKQIFQDVSASGSVCGHIHTSKVFQDTSTSGLTGERAPTVHITNNNIQNSASNESTLSEDSSEEGSDAGDKTDLEDVITIPQYPQLVQVPTRHACDGCGRGSPVLFTPSSAPSSFMERVHIARPLARALEEVGVTIQDKLRTTPPSSWDDNMFENLLQPVEDCWADLVREHLHEEPDLSVPVGQNFRLGLIHQMARMFRDDDIAGVDPPTGVVSYVNKKVPFTGIWPRKKKGDAKFDADRPVELWDHNFVSMDNPPPEWLPEIHRLMEKEFKNNWVEEVHDDSDYTAMGVLGVVFEGYRPCTGPCQQKCSGKHGPCPLECRLKLRIIWDGSLIGLNYHIWHGERQEMASAAEKIAVLQWARASSRRVACLKVDFSAAFRQILIDVAHRQYFGFTWRGRRYRYRVLPFGYKLSSFWWGRHAAVVFRCHKLIMAALQDWISSLLYVDDADVMMEQTYLWVGVAVTMLFLRLLRCPIGPEKTIVGLEVDWQGFDFWWVNGSLATEVISVGVKEKKYLTMCADLIQVLDVGPKVPFLLLCWSTVCHG